MLIGHNPRMPEIIRQIDDLCPKGSKITLLAEEAPAKEFAPRHAGFRYVRGDPTIASDFQKVDVGSFDAIVCLQGAESDADDSQLLVSLKE